MVCKIQKAAVIVGGGNGIGLAIAKSLSRRGKKIFIVDKCAPDWNEKEAYSYIPCDLLNYEESVFEQLSTRGDIDTLMITAGFGKVADFEHYHEAEIENIFQVNAVKSVRIIRSFYQRIKSVEPFYCGVMGSIAGFVSSPMFAVYAGTKAAICRIVESLNVELEVSGTNNRILNVSPGSIKGTCFNGGENQPNQTFDLAEEIVEGLSRRETLYIPEFEEVYKGVLERYHASPHEFGLSSYQYKKESGRVLNRKSVKVGYLSGTFDLFHVGHLNLLKRAKAHCDYLVVGVHPDASHKGKQTFIPFEERLQIIQAIQYVDRAVPSCNEDCDAWPLYKYDRLFVGSDYKGTERFRKYEVYFADKGVEIVYFPYTQGTSSTQIRHSILGKQE